MKPARKSARYRSGIDGPSFSSGRDRPRTYVEDFTISIPDSDDTEQADLRGGRSPWFATGKHPVHLKLAESIKCDALIVGAGITGSLIAERLTRQGLDVVIIDREFPGRGSTAASTSMLLWEIDRSLTKLTQLCGFERASRIYRASLHAVAGLKSLVLQNGIACEMRDRDSLYLAAGDTPKELREEHDLRWRAGLPGRLTLATRHHPTRLIARASIAQIAAHLSRFECRPVRNWSAGILESTIEKRTPPTRTPIALIMPSACGTCTRDRCWPARLHPCVASRRRG